MAGTVEWVKGEFLTVAKAPIQTRFRRILAHASITEDKIEIEWGFCKSTSSHSV